MTSGDSGNEDRNKDSSGEETVDDITRENDGGDVNNGVVDEHDDNGDDIDNDDDVDDDGNVFEDVVGDDHNDDSC